MKKLLQEIKEELERGIERNGTLPLDWAMDRIEPIIREGFKRLNMTTKESKRQNGNNE